MRAATPQDRARLSRLLYPIGEELEVMWAELERSGFELLKLYRAAIERCAGDAESYREVLRYWQEAAKVSIAQLVGPYDVRGGMSQEWAQYDSPYLAQLRRNPASAWIRERGAAAEIEPTLRHFLALGNTEEPKRAMTEAIVNRKRAELAALKLGAELSKTAAPAVANADAPFDYLSELLEKRGYTRHSANQGGAVFSIAVSDTPYVYALSVADRTLDSLNGPPFEILLLARGRSYSAASSRRIALASINLNYVFPGWWVYSRPFRPEHGILAQAAFVEMAEVIRRRIEPRLSGSLSG